MPDKSVKPSADAPNAAKSQSPRKSVKAKATQGKGEKAKGTEAISAEAETAKVRSSGTKGATKRAGKPLADNRAELAGDVAKPSPKRKPSGSKKRPPPRQTFLVAATLAAGTGPPQLRVYAAVVRGAAEALEAVRAELGPEVAVELTGKLSNRMAKALGLQPEEVRPV